MSNKEYSDVVSTTREYYNSEDADNFYYNIWGGEDIHVGLYKDDDEPIFDASRRTVERIASKIENLNKDTYIIDIGAGYGGAARYLAKTYGCNVVALNLSEVENDRDRQMNKEQGLDDKIEVIDGSFDDIPYDDDTFDVVWCQDSILHSDNREKVLEETARILKKGGDFVFTDPMQTDDCPDGVLQPILDRIHLESLASPGFYREYAPKYGMKEVEFEEHAEQLPRHYGRVKKELEANENRLRGVVSDEYIQNMKKGLQHWVNGGNNGYLTWGVFLFKKK